MSGDEATTPTSTNQRTVLGHLPTGVVVVTGVGANGEPLGITIGSFTSISLDPPLAGFFIGRSSRTWPLIAASGKFCANVLAASQTELCWRFAKDQSAKDQSANDQPANSRFGDITFTHSSNGCPVIPNVLATIDCTVQETHAVGDHDLVVGMITNLQVLDPDSAAMVFFKGKTGDAHIAP